MIEQEVVSSVAVATVSEPPLPHLTGERPKDRKQVSPRSSYLKSMLLIGTVFAMVACSFLFLTHRMMVANNGQVTKAITKGWMLGGAMLLTSTWAFMQWFKQRREDAA